MVQYRLNKNLFGDDILIITGLPEKPLVEKKITFIDDKDHLDKLVQRIEMDEYRVLINKMLNARRVAFNHISKSSSFDSSKLDAISELNNKVVILYDLKDISMMASRIKDFILPLLYKIMPAKDSKFYKNYSHQIELISEFIKNHSK